MSDGKQTMNAAPSAAAGNSVQGDWPLRVFDLVLAALALLLLSPALALACLLGQGQHELMVGRQGRPFGRWRLRLGHQIPGAWLRACGAENWPLLWHILRGDMSWVGPRPRPLQAQDLEAPPSVRPGLVNRWWVCHATAVDFSSEAEMDAEDLRDRSLRHHAGILLRAALVSLLPAVRTTRFTDQLRIGDTLIHNLSMDEALGRVEQLLDHGRGELVCFINAACVNIAARNRGYRRALRRAALVLPDGIGIRIAGNLMGTPIKQNVNGTDFFAPLMGRLALKGTRVFLLGGGRGVPQQVAQVIAARWPGVQVVGCRDGYFSAAQEGEVAASIRDSGAQLLLVARGVPLQETFVDRYSAMLGVNVALAVGGLFDFVSGRIPRAPMWLRELGGEWAYRLLQEPGRMWRRYLVGNGLFLARAAWQTLGWLRPRADPLDVPSRSMVLEAPSEVHAVLFATSMAAPDLPLGSPMPAALLPVGHASLIERQVEELARIGVHRIHVVACEAPEALRQCLGEGERWGVTLQFHVVKDPSLPYGVLGSTVLRQAHRVLIGHCDSWIPPRNLARLAESDRVAVHGQREDVVHWSGWASGPGSSQLGAQAEWTRAELAHHLERQSARRLRIDLRQSAISLDGLGLLQLQSLAGEGRARLGAPASWRAMPWGAAHPSAIIADSAQIEGPVMIGPGCVVQEGARIGPHVYLAQDVIVSPQSSIQHCVLMAGTYVGAGLDLEWSVVNGRHLRHVGLRVKTALSAEDGLLLQMQEPLPIRAGSLSGRALAALLMALSLPLALPALLVQLAWARQLPWARRIVMLEPPSVRGCSRLTELRQPLGGLSLLGRWLCVWRSLGEVAQGRRAWFGARPRGASQWYVINPAWQRTLVCQPIGLFHAPAWYEDETCQAEAEAAADIFQAAQPGWRTRLQMLRAACSQALQARPAPTVRPLRAQRS